MSIGTEPAPTDHTAVDSKICNCCNARQPIDQFRRLHKDDDYRRPECKTCHRERERERLAAKREAQRNPLARILDRSREEKHCTTCREVKPIQQFRKRYKAGPQRHGECDDCRNDGERKRTQKKQRKTLATWMAQIHKHRECKSAVQAFVDEMTRHFGGTERLAAVVKQQFDIAKPGGMFRVQVLKCITELGMTASEVKRDEQARRDQEDRPDLRQMTDEELQRGILDSASEALLHDPAMLVAVAVQQPSVVQAEFRKYGWELVPPEEDG